ncbi:helix-turn-helix domain-containing protein [Desulfovibrio intestinalis]|uniref:Transcriptional regulator with XRE-family HTH domain n=1 Tax=Desulfovibrio intestinalis TaxID=58621 RepID=A0A7W8C145_9BACT|nr:transcriptional regulator with XRE-family HTH domain [Desulfovibrio intestinalis]
MKERSNSLTQTVGQAICLRRKALAMSQEELAEKVGIGQQSLSRMEQGKIAPKFERLQLFADALQCRVVDLFLAPESSADACAESLASLLRPLSEEQRSFIHLQTTQLVRFLQEMKKH